MRTRIVSVVAALMVALSTIVAWGPAEAVAPTSVTTQATQVLVPQAPASIDAAAAGWAMGGYPNYWTICAINGVGGTYWPNLVGNWTWSGHKLDLRLSNRCDGYSATNKFVYDYFNIEGDVCGRITNSHRTWSPARGRYIWDQIPHININISDGCVGAANSIAYDHHVQMYVGWLLGLAPDSTICYCVMGQSGYDRGTIRYVVLHDIADMDVIYNH